jgi:DNA-binding IclR family transcriptional regulator
VPLPEALFVTRTMRTLELLALQPLSAPQVASALEVHPRTARRLLARLREEGYLTRGGDAQRLYRPTMRLVAVAGQVVERSPLARAAVPFVRGLHDETGAGVHLMVPSYRSAACVVHGAAGCSGRPQLRELVPSHCTAPGKVLLAFRDEWRESVLSAPLERCTPRTITDPVRLHAEAAKVRAQGYAIEDGEFRPGLRAVAAPVFGHDGQAAAALAATVPEDGTPEAVAERVTALARELTATVEALGG